MPAPSNDMPGFAFKRPPAHITVRHFRVIYINNNDFTTFKAEKNVFFRHRFQLQPMHCSRFRNGNRVNPKKKRTAAKHFATALLV